MFNGYMFINNVTLTDEYDVSIKSSLWKLAHAINIDFLSFKNWKFSAEIFFIFFLFLLKT